MICPVCGNEVPDGTSLCPVCGASLAVAQEPGFAPQDQGMGMQGGMVQGGSKKTGVIIAIIAAVLVIGIVVALVFLLRGGGNKDGRYKTSYLGMINMYIDVHGNKGQFIMEVAPEYAELVDDDDSTQSYDFEAVWKGDVLVMQVQDSEVEVKYNAKDKTLTLPDDSGLGLGVDLVFEKQD